MSKKVNCLRCGYPMNESDIRCPHCHHYYENRVNGVNASYNAKSNSIVVNNNSLPATLIILSIAIIIFAFAFYFIFRENKIVRDTYNNINMDKNSEEYHICNIRCENRLYLIRDNKCICTDGKEYDIE